MTEALLLSTTRLSTFSGQRLLTAATAFFFERAQRLYAVTSRHVLHDEPTQHFPDRVELVLHVDDRNLTRTAVLALPLYSGAQAVWRQGVDSFGEVDVAVIEIDRGALPAGAILRPFGPQHLQQSYDGKGNADGNVGVGEPLLMVGFPLGFYDTLHHLPVVRHAIIASAFGVRFQGQGYFLSDGRMHRGSSGSPVVMRRSSPGDDDMPWRLLGVHSARMDMRSRDITKDETLGLNCVWYADMLMALTQ